MNEMPQFWMIKTTPGDNLQLSYWPDFCGEQVVAIGWEKITVNPTVTALANLKIDVAKSYPGSKQHIDYIASTIWGFARDWQEGDVAIICRGWAANQAKDVHLYGFAIVRGFFYDPKPRWQWKFKRKARIRCIDADVPVSLFQNMLGAARQTTHRIQPIRFQNFSNAIKQRFPNLWGDLIIANNSVKFWDEP